MLCHVEDYSFTCGRNNTDCQLNRNVFTIAGGTNFVLRDVVVAGQSSAALHISPTTILSLVGEASASTASSTASLSTPRSLCRRYWER